MNAKRLIQFWVNLIDLMDLNKQWILIVKKANLRILHQAFKIKYPQMENNSKNPY